MGRDEFIDGAEREQLAVVDDGDVIAQTLGLFHVVRGVHDGAALRAERADQIENGVAGLRVHAGGGLIEHHQRRIMHDRRGEIQAALHAAGKGLGAAGRTVAQPDHFEQFGAAGAELGGGQTVQLAEEGEILNCGELVIQRDGLRGDADESAHGGIGRRAAAVEIDLAGGGREQTDGHVDGGGLSRAVGAEEAEDAAARDVQRETVHRDDRAELLAEIAEREHGRRGGHWRWTRYRNWQVPSTNGKRGRYVSGAEPCIGSRRARWIA